MKCDTAAICELDMIQTQYHIYLFFFLMGYINNKNPLCDTVAMLTEPLYVFVHL